MENPSTVPEQPTFQPVTESRRLIERFRGSSEVPLSSEGLEQAHRVGINLARKGGLHELRSSSLGRALQTAQHISRYTHAPITYVGDGLHPWHLGEFEGQEVTPERIDEINRLVKHAPDERPGPRGSTSTLDGESFNEYKNRTLSFLQRALSDSAADPARRIGLVTHFRVKKLLDAWMRRGTPRDGEVDLDEMTSPTSHKTAGVSRIVNDPNAGPQEFGVDLESPSQLGGGLYIIRHGKTEFNNEQS